MSNTIPMIRRGGGLDYRLAALDNEAGRACLTRGLRGIEKESLRVAPDGTLALTPHPLGLGAALTHPEITTDYSEALLELITPAQADTAQALHRLDVLHRFVHGRLRGELLWSNSMPCALPPEDEIPIAEYGSSNVGRLKRVYRRGLALRYGRTMQCIAGIHYNFSLDAQLWEALRDRAGAAKSTRSEQAFQSHGYLGLIRNFRRTSWLLLYLFGASPVLDRNFMHGRPHSLERYDADTLFLPYATSLRMSDLGYHNAPGQAGLAPSYNTLTEYLGTLQQAVSQPFAAYEALGTKRDGEWWQLNGNVLQIENEFYATIRPKRVTLPGERPLQALAARGVQYVEARCIDIDPFEPIGLSLTTARFLDAYLLYCALEDSSPLSPAALQEADANFVRVAKEGRKPELLLERAGEAARLQDWTVELLARIEAVAALLDAAQGASGYRDAVTLQRSKSVDVNTTPSARVLQAMRASGQGFRAFTLAQSRQHAEYFLARRLPSADTARLDALARDSLADQARRERDDATTDFDALVASYVARAPVGLDL